MQHSTCLMVTMLMGHKNWAAGLTHHEHENAL